MRGVHTMMADGPSPSQPPATIWLGSRSFWRPRLESPANCRLIGRWRIGFHWAGCEEGDEVEGEGTAELLDDGTIEIEFA
jgi:hypothetical protein